MSTRTFNLLDTIETRGWTSDTCVAGVQDHVTAYTRGHKTGRNTPDFHKRLKAGGLLPLNAYQRVDRGGKRTGGYSCTINDPYWGGCHGMTVHNTHPLIPFLGHDGNDVQAFDLELTGWVDLNTDALLIEAISDMLPDLDALTTAIEASRTIEMVKQVRQTAKDLIREALRGGKHTAKAAANAWLAWRYGWEQLGRDVVNVYDLVTTPLRSLVIDGRAGWSVNESGIKTGALSTWQSASFTPIYLYEHDANFRASAVGILSCKTLNLVADPALSAWEVVPYSFVADWFVNIGDVLGAWKVVRSLDRLETSLSLKRDLRINGNIYSVNPGSSSKYVSQSGSASSREWYKSLERIPGYVPQLVPSITVSLTSKRILDAAALLSKRIL